MVMVAQSCEYTKTQGTVHFKTVTCMVCGLCRKTKPGPQQRIIQ